MNQGASSSADWSVNFDLLPTETRYEGAGTQSLKTEIDALWTVAGRIGYTWDRWLAYVKGGYAGAKMRTTSNVSGEFNIIGPSSSVDVCAAGGFSVSGRSDDTRHGWMVGGGVDHMVHKNVTLGLDYSYIDLESKAYTVQGECLTGFLVRNNEFFGSPTMAQKVNVDPDAIHAVSARLTFLFGRDDKRVEPLK